MSTPVVEKTKAATFTATTKQAIKADASGQAPTRLQIIASGLWMESWKGNLEITISDLVEMKTNFDQGIGLADGGSAGAAIDYAHADYDKAAGWIKELEVENGILYASEIEWTPAAQKAIADGEWKFFSPSFYPACLGSWYDPEDPTVTARNVLLGGGLTNIPFFKKLSGLKASQFPQGADDENTIYITSKGDQMKLEDVRKIEASALTTEQKTFLAEHKDELTKEERVSFGFEEATAPVVTASAVTGDDAKVIASIKSGEMKLVKASEYDALNSTVTDLKGKVEASTSALEDIRKKDITAKVTAAATAGKFKTDQIDKWVGRVMADNTLLEDIEALPVNPILASEIGKQGDNGASAKSQIDELVAKKITASREAQREISLGDAMSEVRRENAELARAYDAEVTQKV